MKRYILLLALVAGCTEQPAEVIISKQVISEPAVVEPVHPMVGKTVEVPRGGMLVAYNSLDRAIEMHTKLQNILAETNVEEFQKFEDTKQQLLLTGQATVYQWTEKFTVTARKENNGVGICQLDNGPWISETEIIASVSP